MPTVEIWTPGDEEPVKYNVDAAEVDALVDQLGDPNAVLVFQRHRGVAFVPVRHVAIMNVLDDPGRH